MIIGKSDWLKLMTKVKYVLFGCIDATFKFEVSDLVRGELCSLDKRTHAMNDAGFRAADDTVLDF